MAIKEIIKLGNPVLKKKSDEVKVIDKEIKALIQDLKDTLYSTDGIGLAAPQLGVNKRIIFIDTRNNTQPILLINPVIKRRFGKQESEEGCLSYPGFYGIVERPKSVYVKGINEQGEEVKYKGTELLCRAFCHEIDHLNGVMFTDKAYELYEEGKEEQ